MQERSDGEGGKGQTRNKPEDDRSNDRSSERMLNGSNNGEMGE